MNDTPIENPDTATLKWLRILVIAMTTTMIIGFIIIVGLLIAKFNSLRGEISEPAFPDEIILPNGIQADAFTTTKDWFAIITNNDKILVYNRDSGKLIQQIVIKND